jgi:tRNA(Ile)-lysidine synthase
MLAPAAPLAEPLTDAEADALFAGQKGRLLLLAVSGGPDSVAMMALAASWAERHGARGPRVAVVDHALRQGSRDEAEEAVRQAAALGLSADVLTWADPKSASGVQAAARAARYRLLAEHAVRIGADALVTAHTLDDQAETVLMRLSRGSGVAGLAGMAAETVTNGVRHFRPLLSVAKARLVATCAARGLHVVHDPSNSQPRFARARWRAARALLESEGLSPERLAVLARRAAEADAAVRHGARALLANAADEGGLDMRHLTAQPFAIAVATLALWLEDAPLAVRLERLEETCRRLLGSATAARPLRLTLAGLVLSLDARGHLSRMPERRRGGIVNPVAGPRLGKGARQP